MSAPTSSERDVIMAFAEQQLEWSQQRDEFLASGRLPSCLMAGEAGGPDTPRRSFTRQVVRLYRECDVERQTRTAWHAYCREHGYRPDDHGPDAPPWPARGGGVWVEMKWSAIRAELLVSAGDRQLELELA
jgi:hypothetical protein